MKWQVQLQIPYVSSDGSTSLSTRVWWRGGDGRTMTTEPSAVSNLGPELDAGSEPGNDYVPPRETVSVPDPGVWEMPREIFVVTMAILTSECLLAICTNLLLVVTIWHSPSLKTPPNAHLVNICITNLVLAGTVLFAIISLISSGLISRQYEGVIDILGSIELFLSTTAFMQYWNTFAAIAHYRYRTIKKPSLSLKIRRRMITRSTVICWLLSFAIGLTMTLSFKDSDSTVSWNAFRRRIHHREVAALDRPSLQQSLFLYFVLSLIVVGLILVANSYYWISKSLYAARPPPCKNRVSPFARPSSVSSDDTEFTNRRSYIPDEQNWEGGGAGAGPPFTVSGGNVAQHFVVHYQKRQHSLSLDEVFALENPLQASAQQAKHRQLRATLSNISNGSKHSSVQGGSFSDISPSAELQRFQNMKNSYALRNQSLKKDRLSLKASTKNSVIMLSTFIVCSGPLFFCSIPGLLPATDTHSTTTTLLFCQWVFFLNAPAYPIWYLLFSKRVRKCLFRLYENTLIRLNLRQ